MITYSNKENECPYCGSNNISIVDEEFDYGGGWRSYFCDDCDKEFEAFYEVIFDYVEYEKKEPTEDQILQEKQKQFEEENRNKLNL